jgi:hypothetical protein
MTEQYNQQEFLTHAEKWFEEQGIYNPTEPQSSIEKSIYVLSQWSEFCRENGTHPIARNSVRKILGTVAHECLTLKGAYKVKITNDIIGVYKPAFRDVLLSLVPYRGPLRFEVVYWNDKL